MNLANIYSEKLVNAAWQDFQRILSMRWYPEAIS